MPVIRLPSLLFPAAALCAGLASSGCDRQSGDTTHTKSEAAAPAALNGTLDISERGASIPDATLSLPDGTIAKLADFSGKPLLVNLWATWCAPCIEEMPMLDALAEEERDRLRVLTVSQDLGGADQVSPYFEEAGFTRLEPWLDEENTLGFHYDTGMLPTTILYDAQGREVWRMIGGHDWSNARTKALLGETLGPRSAAVPGEL